jgi:hypothetical protein
LIFVLGFIALFFYLIKSRDEFLIALKSQQSKELAKSIELVECSKKKILRSKQNLSEKKKRIRRLNRAKKEIIHNIKKRQAIQKKEFKKLDKSKKKKTMQEQLNSWKNQGYKMIETEEGLAKFGENKKQIEKWKKQGYKFY